ncbi:MAG: sugar ABC transporter permease [Acholeplasma sp.]|nr:sugar ABC transporter permease [Acholeplasma sp.]
MLNKKKVSPYLYIIPAFIVIGLIIVYPIMYTFYISFTNMNIYHWFDFEITGLSNYSKALFVFDLGFIKALLITIIWTIVNMVLQLVIAYLIANLLNNKLLKRGKNIYKMLLMVPWAIPGYVSILLWKNGIFNVQFGLLNQWLNTLGFQSVQWLNQPVVAFTSMTVLNLWLALPFMIMIMDGALQSIDRSYYEVAQIEGASKFEQSRYITIPLIKSVIGPAVVITAFTTFKQFDIVYLLTLQPASRTGAGIHTIITYAYENAFITSNYGYSSAISIIIFIMLVSFTLLTSNDFRRKKHE